jgi:predicted HicB family RNase H-like nuclease
MKTRHARFAVPPGQHALEELKARGLEFADLKRSVSGLTTEHDLESGTTVIVEEVAEAIGRALDMPAKVWIDLERRYRRAVSDGLPALSNDAIDAAQARAASGKLLLRLPASLHRRAAEAAQLEGVSLNQLLLSYIAEGIGKTEGSHSLG